MTTDPVVIGEGTYGCVHKPSLQCKEPGVNYINKISKVMKKKHAIEELKEYAVMDSIDKNKKYYLGNPVKCKAMKTLKNFTSIEKCRNGQELLKKFSDTSLLILEDGGINLETFAIEYGKLPSSPVNDRKLRLFWLEAHRILVGLKLFIDNKIIHHDLKAQNLVYNTTRNRVNFIDFGFMTTQKKIIRSSSKSTNYLSKCHWSFPLEMEFYDKINYTRHAKKQMASKLQIYNTNIDDFKNSISTPVSKAMRIFFSYVLDKTSPDYDVLLDRYLKDYYNMVIHNMNDESKYNDFIQKSVNTIDIYGVGIAFMYILIKTSHLIRKSMAEQLHELFYLMLCPDLNKRVDIDILLSQYETILQDNGILAGFDKHFENHQLKQGPMIPSLIRAKIASIDKDEIVLSTQEKKDILLNPGENVCPPGKVLNPKTNRCVNVKPVKTKTVKNCPAGQILNPKTNRCVKVKPVKTKTVKNCPAGKVINPKTNRCINPPVVKNKTVKNCPAGKVLNTKTNRCVKVKPIKIK